MSTFRLVVASASLAALLVASCGPPGSPDDAGASDVSSRDSDARADAAPRQDGGPCSVDSDCDDSLYCNGAERCLAGVCQPAASPPCDDHATCTTDRCDESTHACTHVADDSICGDSNACDGIERCLPGTAGTDPGTGCQSIDVDDLIDCDDGNTCTIDGCDPAVGCVHAPRDLDGDGHVDRVCTVDGTPSGRRGDDCDDSDPTVFPGAAEQCSNGRDDNCNMLVDFEDPGCVAGNDTCDTATVLPGPGSYVGTTTGLQDDYALSCGVRNAVDAAYVFTLTEAHDVTLATSSTSSGAAIAVFSGCTPAGEIRCAALAPSMGPTLHLHGLAAGTYHVVVETGDSGSAFGLTLSLSAPTVVPVEDTCPGSGDSPAVDISDGLPRVAHLAALDDDYALSCSFGDAANDAVYRITLTAPSDVEVTASADSGSTFVSLRTSPCAVDRSEIDCEESDVSDEVVASQHGLAAGTYWAVVENSSGADVTVSARIVTPPVPIVHYTLALDPTGAAFVDVCALSAHREVLAMSDDENVLIPEITGTPSITIPFAVRFYGQLAAPPFTVDTNGWMALAMTRSTEPFGLVGDPAAPDFVIAPLWDDLVLRTRGVCYAVVGAAPDRRFVVQWDDAWDRDGGTSTHLTFEAVIHEATAGSDNVIDLAYGTVSSYDGFPSMGIENEDGSLYTLYDVDQPAAGTVVRFTPSM